jgi:hypothetical protein
MESQETDNQSDRPTNDRFTPDLIILYGGVILILGFVLGTMTIK